MIASNIRQRPSLGEIGFRQAYRAHQNHLPASLFPLQRTCPCRRQRVALLTKASSEKSSSPKLALKEWAVTCAALEAGEQTILLRKGGIREPGFRLPDRKFLLFPNAFHTDQDSLAPTAREKYVQALQLDPKQDNNISLSVAAEVTGIWQTTDPDVLLSLSAFHIWSDAFILKRLEWRKAQQMTILELKCSKLKKTLRLPQSEMYWGCFSFVELDVLAMPGEGWQEMRSVLSDEEFSSKQAALRSVLRKPSVEALDVH